MVAIFFKQRMSKRDSAITIMCDHGAEWGRTFRVFFCVSRLSVHSDGLFVLLDLTNIIKLESGEKKKS